MDVVNTGIVIGAVQAVKNLFPAKIAGLVTVVVAAVVGIVLVTYQAQIVDLSHVITGIFQGLVAVGVITTATKVSGK